MRRVEARLSAVIVGLVLLAACAPSESAGGGAQESGPAPEREKILTVMIQQELASFDDQMTEARTATRAGGRNHVPAIVKAELTRVDEAGQRQPWLATEVPTQAKGTVVVNPDGTMDATWKLRPDAYWHDGTPVTTADYVFRRRAMDELQIVGNLPPGFLKSVTALDAKTMVVRWAVPYVRYDEENVANLPKHILGDLYDRDKDALALSRYFRDEFVGTGPFKVVAWEPGSHIEFRRHDLYHLGVPPIHRVILRFVQDPNTMVANLLAGAVDVSLPEGIDMEKAIELRKRWQEEGTGHQVNSYITPALFYLEIMVDPQYARPISALPVAAVRQGLYHGIDRATVNQVLHGDLGMVADSFYAPNDKYYPMVKDVIPPYPYDPRRARQLIEQSGWTMGPDGVYVHPASGPTKGSPWDLPSVGEERFDVQLMLFPGQQHVKMGSVIQANWKDAGVNATLESLTPANQADPSYTSRRSGLYTSNPGGSAFYTGRLLCTSIPTEANRWSGSNRGHWCNPVTDDLLTKITYTIPPAEQQVLHRALLAETMGKAMMYPLYWESVPIIMVKGVTGPNMLGSVTTMDIHKWDKN